MILKNMKNQQVFDISIMNKIPLLEMVMIAK
jgi:hypothetical protein